MSDLIRREDAMRLAESGKLLSGSFGERAKDIIASIPSADNSITLLPNNELLVDSEYAEQTKTVRLMNAEGFTRVLKEENRGKWEFVRDACGFGISKCSECGKKYYLFPLDFNYCPNCGARMEENDDRG